MEPLERRAREVELLRKRYGTVEHDQDYSWVLIRDIDVPDGWNRSKTDILALLGPNVPDAARQCLRAVRPATGERQHALQL